MSSNNTEIKLNKKFYSSDCILLTSREFSENFWIALEENEKEFVVLLEYKKEKAPLTSEKISREFANYALSLMHTSD